MSSFPQRWNNALNKLKETPDKTSILNNKTCKSFINSRLAMFETAGGGEEKLRKLKNAFSNSSFIYGTVGKKAAHYGNRGNPAIVALQKWHSKTVKGVKNKQNDAHGRSRADLVLDKKFANFSRHLNLYDPGPRTEQYIRQGHQMMDQYFGMDNKLHMNRIPIIAEFVHYAMDFKGEFDFSISGKQASLNTFSGDGWENRNILAKYGQSTTKEISKIIRTGIKEWGGVIIFEGKAVYGSSIFDEKAYSGDTDLEAQELFKAFTTGAGPRVPYGKGFIEFQWGGIPTIPSKAHFLTNWLHRDDGLVHTYLNRISDDKLDQLFTNNHGLRPIWNNFQDFSVPIAFSDRKAFIEMIGESVSYAYGSGRMRRK